ncbi:MAG: hypothetical protein HZB27_07865 [Meiothermus silvanus]|nr:hypothetical protein [Allomeiothermus silvanus]
MDIEQQVLEALNLYVSRGAALNLLKRAIKAGGGAPLSPEDWVRLIEGPLMRELGQILPVRGVLPPFKAILAKLRSSPAPRNPTPSFAEEPETAPPLERVPLSNPTARQGLVQSLARLEGVAGVILETPYGREVRIQGLGPEFRGSTRNRGSGLRPMEADMRVWTPEVPLKKAPYREVMR